MGQERLLERIDRHLREQRLSDRKASLLAQVGPDFIRDIRRRGHSPKAEKLVALARVLKIDAAELLEGIDLRNEPPQAVRLKKIQVRGAVQAGAWRESVEWPLDDWFSVTVPEDERYPTARVFGLQVRGSSMDRYYPEGTIVLAISFFDVGRPPQPGERVVVLRRSPTGEFEATLKEYETDRQGRHLLWPRSTDPEFQAPIILPADQLPISLDNAEMPVASPVAAFNHDAGIDDLLVAALVIGSYRRE